MDKPDKYLIIMAAGHGSRMKSELPKQFLEIGGVVILRRTIQKFIDAIPDIKVITVLPLDGDYVKWWRDYCVRTAFLCPQKLVRGGITRFHSVKSALADVPDGAIVAVHDGVRPLLSVEMIRSMFSTMERCAESVDGVIPVTPMVDTLKILKKQDLGSGNACFQAVRGAKIDRATVFGAQTPQIFLSEKIKAAYSQPFDTSFTDDASVAEANEMPLAYVEGERLNIKLTSPEDLSLAEAILSLKKTR